MTPAPSASARPPPLPQRPRRWGVLALLAGTLLALPLLGGESLVPAPQELRALAAQISGAEGRRVQGWAELLETGLDVPLTERLAAVNGFFNELAFVSDDLQWGEDDYWATPLEFLRGAAGDCEDFAIAKYFTLIALGVPEQRLKLTYVKALRLNQAHMVLTYYATPAAEPLVLDNLEPEILPASRRPDLVPVYSFNGAGLWLATQRGAGERIGSATRLSRWQELLARLAGRASPAPPAHAKEQP